MKCLLGSLLRICNDRNGVAKACLQAAKGLCRDRSKLGRTVEGRPFEPAKALQHVVVFMMVKRES